MEIRPIFDPQKMRRPMRIAAFMSGSGTNIKKLLAWQKKLEEREGKSPFEVIFIFSDRSDGKCVGEEIALDNGLPYFSYDIRAFHRIKSVSRSVASEQGLSARKQYDQIPRKLSAAFEIDVIALGGYMSYTTLPRCVNVHPADLSILSPDGARKYVGDNAVYDAIVAGEKSLRASTLWTDEGVDTGPLLMVSEAMPVELPEPLDSLINDRDKLAEIVDTHQEKLKRVGDWVIFPTTIEMIARGRLAIDEQGNVYADGKKTEGGFRL